MKKMVALILTAVLVLALFPSHAEETGKYDRLIVGTTTPFSGNFLSDALGSNLSDQDVRRLVHGYNLVVWDSASGAFQFNERLFENVTVSEDRMTYTFPLPHNLTYNDGSPITAGDYAFSLLLLGSSAMKEATGACEDISRIRGGKDYQDGVSRSIAGVRLLGRNQFSITIDEAYSPYFYQLKALDIFPLPADVLAPGCEIRDDGQGAYIDGPFTAEILKKTMTDPDSGYISHPAVSSGPYQLAEYDGQTVTLDLNTRYLADKNGGKPSIPRIVIRTEDPDRVIEDLSSGNLDLAVRCARRAQVDAGRQLTRGGNYFMKAYSRAGLSYISFCAEKGPTADEKVRKAVAMCMDEQTLTDRYLGAYGTPVKGYYGIGQWMFMMANGTMIPEKGEKAEWADLTLDGIPEYKMDEEEITMLLDTAGWYLNSKGEAYNPGDGVRYRKEGNQLIPLALKLIYPEGNGAGPLLEECFIPDLNRAGIMLETASMPMPQLLEKYYGQAERDCDMILLGTNFADVFDPSGQYDENGTSRLNGITDPELAELSVRLRSTEPGSTAEYCRRWLAYLARRAALVSEIPLYSDAYLDFHIAALQHYEPGTTGVWSIAIQNAYLSDYAAGEEHTGDELPD